MLKKTNISSYYGDQTNTDCSIQIEVFAFMITGSTSYARCALIR